MRLQQMSIAQQIRLSHETPDQREARLEEMSIAQEMRLMRLRIREGPNLVPSPPRGEAWYTLFSHARRPKYPQFLGDS